MAPVTAGAPGGPSRPGVYLEGLTDLRRVLKRADKNLDRDLARSIREIGKGVQAEVRTEARRFADTGTLARSIRYSVRQKSASVYTNLDYGPVHEWGGTIRPRGVPIQIRRRQFMRAGVDNSRREIDKRLGRLLDDLADTWGA